MDVAHSVSLWVKAPLEGIIIGRVPRESFSCPKAAAFLYDGITEKSDLE